MTLPTTTSNEQEIMNYMLMAFRKYYKKEMPYKQAGVILTQISSENVVERDIFDQRDREKDNRLQQALEKVTTIYGKGQVRFATQASKERGCLQYKQPLSEIHDPNQQDIDNHLLIRQTNATSKLPYIVNI